MISAPLGLALILATLLLGRAIKVRTHIEPLPWWLSDDMVANLIAPALVTAAVFGIGILISSVVVHGWGVFAPGSLAGVAACIAVHVLAWRGITAWSRRVGLGAAPALAPAAAQNDANQPPQLPPLKKAA
jgi:hypothetical protein